MNLKKLLALFLIVVFLNACAGTPPRPVAPYEYGDEKKGCDILFEEAATCKAQILELDQQRTGKIIGNTFLAIVGIALFFPFLFAINTQSDEHAEMRGYAKRQGTLIRIASDNNCEWCKDEMKLAELALPEIPAEVKSAHTDEWAAFPTNR